MGLDRPGLRRPHRRRGQRVLRALVRRPAPAYRGAGFSVPASAWDGVRRYPLDLGAAADGRRHAAYFVESDGDVSIAIYDPVEGGGWFEVTRYEEATGAFEGRFEGVFAVRPYHAASPRRELPDTLRVTGGRFRTVVDDRRRP